MGVTYFGAQAHRLLWLADENQIEAALVDRYGRFRPRLDFGELHVAVQAGPAARLPPTAGVASKALTPSARRSSWAERDTNACALAPA
ncbi:hypothetical protein Aple_095240 [Acrocarpospora pleiomorpha]|uniref:Uncharacterized protein n=1 Tax=Acrocarpospora pleiomorpha TaxID=90975 RepID=A0A5M3XZU5_9ACTN|nr:hypothetical protein Aple_095240 [Acrocarpospora pleiomorpha]